MPLERTSVERLAALSAADPRAEKWRLIAWPTSEPKPLQYALTTLPKDMPCARMGDTAKLRWRGAREYAALKHAVGLGHVAGSGGRGCHHHATRCMAAYGFLVSARATIPPAGSDAARRSQTSALSEGRRSRHAALAPPTSSAEFQRTSAMASPPGSHQTSAALPLWSYPFCKKSSPHLMMQ
jgi:hypothetical protein